MKYLLSSLILLFIFNFNSSTFLFANDGTFYSSGGNLYPLIETRIELKKEILSITKFEKDWIRVNVYFEFNNPDSERTLTVGFVTPGANGDVSDEELSHPQIKEFSVLFNSIPLAWQVYRSEDTLPYRIVTNFTYYFETLFKPGVNIIQHSYLFRGGYEGVGINYSYVITTGKSWANGEIGDFELNIDLGAGTHYLPQTFWNTNEKIDWKIIGTGNILPGVFENRFSKSGELLYSKFVNIQSGYVSFHAGSFKPDEEINTGDFDADAERNRLWCTCTEQDQFRNMFGIFQNYFENIYITKKEILDHELGKLSEKDLKLTRYLLYARKGYVFTDKSIQDIFTVFSWYIPNPSLKEEDILFSLDEQALLDKVKKLEQKFHGD